MKCYQAKAGELAKHWFIIDAEDKVVGRLAAQIAPILMGKHRPTYTPHIDTGDYVIVTNVDKVVFTGNKWRQKFYQRYSGYPGGQTDEAAWKLFERQPERILELAIQRMMPKNKIGRHMMAKLKLYCRAQPSSSGAVPHPARAHVGTSDSGRRTFRHVRNCQRSREHGLGGRRDSSTSRRPSCATGDERSVTILYRPTEQSVQHDSVCQNCGKAFTHTKAQDSS